MSITLVTETINSFFERNQDRLWRVAGRISSRSPLVGPGTLLHNAYLELRDKHPTVNDEGHFLKRLVCMLRNDLRDIARRGRKTASLTNARIREAKALGPELEVRDALRDLKTADSRAAEITHLYYFEGWEQNEVADRLGVSRSTVKSDLRTARAWIHSSFTAKYHPGKPDSPGALP